MTLEQQTVFDAIASGKRGLVQGPLRVWLQSPKLADRAQALGEFCRYETRLPPRLSELAILVTGSFWGSGFEWAVHAPIAIQSGLAPEIVEDIRVGKTPNFQNKAEAAIYAYAHELHHTHRVSDETHRAAVELLSPEGVVELVGILGYYTLISMTINAFDVPLPKGVADPF
ncbi:carboxymuconolactone decarboxylase family protein [Thioclava sp.]|uniref:carboxymuconolactone decarboxylase family protein n=1 Tax=Thioclava sp. TaxID=1933450 RepID=UPI003AA8C914